MAEQTEQVYEWDVARIGDESPEYVYEVTRENIADYCRAVRYENPIYVNDGAARGAGLPGTVAPPTMMYTYAPQRRSAVIEAHGYIAPEQSQTIAPPPSRSTSNRRPTQVRAQHPLRINQGPLPRGLRQPASRSDTISSMDFRNTRVHQSDASSNSSLQST